METYSAKVTVQHDAGRTTFSFLVTVLETGVNLVKATEAAVKQVTKAEKCSEEAILSITIKHRKA